MRERFSYKAYAHVLFHNRNEARRIAANIAKLRELLPALSASGACLMDVVLVTRGTDWVNKTRLSQAGQPSIVRMLRTDTAGIPQVY